MFFNIEEKGSIEWWGEVTVKHIQLEKGGLLQREESREIFKKVFLTLTDTVCFTVIGI